MAASASILQTIVVAASAGTAIQAIASRARFPSIAPLLLGGVLLGPHGIGWVDPGSLGPAFGPFVHLAVAIILFEGALTLDIRGLRCASGVIQRLVTAGAAVTWLLTAVLAYLLLDVALLVALLLGALVIATGPTVVTPLLRRVGLSQRVHHILHWEAVLIEPIGVFVAILCFEWMVLTGPAYGLLGSFLARILVGVISGVGTGFALGVALRRRIIPHSHCNVAVLCTALLLFGLSNQLLEHTGVLSVTVAGLTLAWQRVPSLGHVRAFAMQLTEIAIALLFIVLAADLDTDAFWQLGGRGCVLLTLVLVVVRPLGVFAASVRENMSIGERLFLSWIAPRGVVAASMASLIAIEVGSAQYDGVDMVKPFTFSVIAATVLLQGSTAGIAARLLGVRLPERRAWLIVGARALGRAVARALSMHGIEVACIDTNRDAVQKARASGVTAYQANALDVALPADPRLSRVGAVLCTTDNAHLNRAAAARWAEDLGEEAVHTWHDLWLGAGGDNHPQVDVLGHPSAARRALERGAAELCSLRGAESFPGIDGRAIFGVRARRAWVATGGSMRGAEHTVVLRWRSAGPPVVLKAAVNLPRGLRSVVDANVPLVRAAAVAITDLDARATLADLCLRERAGMTSIGQGVAILHVMTAIVDVPTCVVGVLPQGLAPQSADTVPVRILFLLLSPVHAAELHLGALAAIAGWASSKERVEQFLGVDSPFGMKRLLLDYFCDAGGLREHAGIDGAKKGPSSLGSQTRTQSYDA